MESKYVLVGKHIQMFETNLLHLSPSMMIKVVLS
jgi:hypothetical protein